MPCLTPSFVRRSGLYQPPRCVELVRSREGIAGSTGPPGCRIFQTCLAGRRRHRLGAERCRKEGLWSGRSEGTFNPSRCCVRARTRYASVDFPLVTYTPDYEQALTACPLMATSSLSRRPAIWLQRASSPARYLTVSSLLDTRQRR